MFFLRLFTRYWDKMSTFVHANSRRATSYEVGAAIGREHYILRKVFANALFLVVLNVGTSEHKSRAMQR